MLGRRPLDTAELDCTRYKLMPLVNYGRGARKTCLIISPDLIPKRRANARGDFSFKFLVYSITPVFFSDGRGRKVLCKKKNVLNVFNITDTLYLINRGLDED